MYLSGQWYQLTAKADLTKDDPVEGLDVAYLQREFLQPYLDIQDPKHQNASGMWVGSADFLSWSVWSIM